MPFLLMIMLSIKNTKCKQKLAIEKEKYCNSLIDHERRLESVMNAIPDGLLVITDRMELKTWNEELVTLLCANKTEESLKAALTNLTYESEMKRYESKNMSLWLDIMQFTDSTQNSQTFGTTFLHGRNLEWKGSRCSWNQSKACILTVRDSTDWMNMQEKSKQESACKTALLRSVSHELRTPTHAIINLVREVLEDTELTPLSKEDLSSVRICSCFLLSMINDLLDYSQVLAGQFKLVKINFNLEKEIRQSVLLFESQCRSKSLGLTLNIDPLLPVLVKSDPNRVKQVLLNLLSNAVK
jgi:signal transduction histidine kinase